MTLSARTEFQKDVLAWNKFSSLGLSLQTARKAVLGLVSSAGVPGWQDGSCRQAGGAQTLPRASKLHLTQRAP